MSWPARRQDVAGGAERASQGSWPRTPGLHRPVFQRRHVVEHGAFQQRRHVPRRAAPRSFHRGRYTAELVGGVCELVAGLRRQHGGRPRESVNNFAHSLVKDAFLRRRVAEGYQHEEG